MPDLLLELLSEEIPARMQGRAADDLRRLVTDALVADGFLYEGAQAFATPRRLTLLVAGLPGRGKDVREERKGPRVGAPEAALAGFLKSAGVASVADLTVQTDPKKGEFYVAIVERAGRPTIDVLAELLPRIIRTFPWPKSMRWGAASREPGSLTWVRPLRSILCTFGVEGETPEIVPFAIGGIASGDSTQGHRFLAPAPISVRRFDDYVAALDAAKVVLDAGRRRDIIQHDARDLAFAQGLEVIEDAGLLDEVAGLVEWPVVLMGAFEERFLDIPPEVIRATIRANQKCFVLRRAPDGAPETGLTNKFILVSNLEASDGGAAIVAGNERVVRARLSDAKFFWETDKATRLEDRLERLRSIVFHEKLGTQFERVERIAALARDLAPAIGADPNLAERAAWLAKADLVTEMVGEFPELQGLMGRYYATARGEPASVAAAIEEHYKPVGPSDGVPTDPVSVAVALADKLDTLVGFWLIDEKPTGSKDPYALRRGALGVLRLVLENKLRLPLKQILQNNYLWHLLRLQHTNQIVFLSQRGELGNFMSITAFLSNDIRFSFNPDFDQIATICTQKDKNRTDESEYSVTLARGIEDFYERRFTIKSATELIADLLAFFHDRLKVYLRDRGARHDLIDAVLSAGCPAPHAEVPGEAGPRSTRDGDASFGAELRSAPQDKERGGEGALNDDLLAIVRRVEALGRFLATEDGTNLLAGTKRAANILRIEEKKDGRRYEDEPDPSAFVLGEERELASGLDRAAAAAESEIGRDDLEAAMAALAGLRPGVDAFFEAVTVNDPDPTLRENRLKLLAKLRRATRDVADFAKIEG